MGFKEHHLFYFFQFFGVVPCKFKPWISVLLFLMICLSYQSLMNRTLAHINKDSVYGMSRFSTHVFLEFTRITIIISSLVNLKKFEKIFQMFQEFDKSSERLYGKNMAKSKECLYLATKSFSFIAFAVTFMMTSISFLQKSEQSGAILRSTCLLALQLKGLSFVYFVDLLNLRLEKLLQSSQIDLSQKALKLHTKLFLLSRKINESHNFLMTLVTLQNCYTLIFHSFSIFYFSQNPDTSRLVRKL